MASIGRTINRSARAFMSSSISNRSSSSLTSCILRPPLIPSPSTPPPLGLGLGLGSGSGSNRCYSSMSIHDVPDPDTFDFGGYPPPFAQEEDLEVLYQKAEYWRVEMWKTPPEDMSRDDIINYYVKMLALVLGGNEEEAKKKICFVSTKYIFNFVCKLSRPIADQLTDVLGVFMVEPMSDRDFNRTDYAATGEPFINGEAVPYDPKYHAALLAYIAGPRTIRSKQDVPEKDESLVREPFDRTRKKERVALPLERIRKNERVCVRPDRTWIDEPYIRT